HAMDIRLLALAALAAAPLAAAPADTSTGAFPAGQSYAAPEMHAPAQVSRVLVRTIPFVNGRATIDIPASGSNRLLVWTIPVPARTGATARVTTSLATPGGRSLAAAEDESAQRDVGRLSFEAPDLGLPMASAQQVIHVERPEAGPYHVELASDDASAATVV